MRFLHGARESAHPQAQVRASLRARLYASRFFLSIILCLGFAIPACSQDSGSAERESFGKGSEITVIVHDSSGEPISVPAMVKLYRDGTIPSGQQQTSRGSAVLFVNYLGEFTASVEAAGYATAQKEVSVSVSGRIQVDIYLQRTSAAGTSTGVPGRPLLAPKARDAVNKSLRALSADKMDEAEKHVDEAMRLAPSHPDVLYVRGVLSLKQRNWAQAQNALEKATQIDPSYARAFAALGMALCDQGKYDAAIEPLQKALQLDAAASWETRWTLAKAYYQHEQYADALKMSQDALAGSQGKAPEIELLVAQSLTAVGRYDDAAQTLREFLKDHGNSGESATAQRWLERLTASGKLQARSN